MKLTDLGLKVGDIFTLGYSSTKWVVNTISDTSIKVRLHEDHYPCKPTQDPEEAGETLTVEV